MPTPNNSPSMAIRVQADVEALAFLPEDQRNTLLEFHAIITGSRAWNWKKVREEIGYDNSTMSRAFRGKYTGSYDRVCAAITAFLKKKKSGVSKSEFRANGISKKIWNVLEYALATSTGALIIGPSRTGKTESVKAFVNRTDKHGRKDRIGLVTSIACRPSGGVGGLRASILQKIGASQKLTPIKGDELILRRFGPNHLLIFDEAHRLVSASGSAKSLDYIRWLHDETGCGFALVATGRFEDMLLDSSYMFEQLIGRVEAPIQVGVTITGADWHPIADQFIPGGVAALPKETTIALRRIVDSSGHFASLVHTLRLAQRDAKHRNEEVGDAHILRAIKWRRDNFNGRFFQANTKKEG